MKKFILILFLVLLFPINLNAYGKEFGNDDDSIRISLPRFVNYRNSILADINNSVNITNEKEIYSNEYIDVNIDKPIVQISNNIRSEKIINLQINSIVDGFKNRIIEESKKDNEQYKIDGLPLKQYVAYVNNTVHYNKNNILSLTLSMYSYLGGAHGSTEEISLNLDTNTGKNGSIKDFLGNNIGYDEIILKEIKAQVSQNPEMYFKDVVDNITKLSYNQKFFLTDNAIVVYFDEYEIAPYVAGRPSFIIPFSKFPNGLNQAI